MSYNLQNTIQLFNSGEKLKYLFFWGHSNSSEYVTKACFSQWFPSPFSKDSITYRTAEHWMMAKKAQLFNDEECFQKIIASSKPGEAKDLGRRVKNFDQATWEANRFEIVVEGNLLKFSQNPSLAEFLINTKNRVLVEASPVDNIWGIGMAISHPDINTPNNWKGQNLLGFALMKVRAQLKDN